MDSNYTVVQELTVQERLQVIVYGNFPRNGSWLEAVRIHALIHSTRSLNLAHWVVFAVVFIISYSPVRILKAAPQE